jgi:hypothetical protein
LPHLLLLLLLLIALKFIRHLQPSVIFIRATCRQPGTKLCAQTPGPKSSLLKSCLI